MPETTDENQKPAAPAPKVNLEELAKIEEHLLEKIEQRAKGKKLEATADAEMAEIENAAPSTVGVEQAFLMVGAALMILSLPFMHYLLAIVLTLFAVAIALVAGFSSPHERFTVRLNLAMSLIGLLVFEYTAIFIHTAEGASNGFWLYQVLAFIFLFATFFSARTYRRKVLEE